MSKNISPQQFWEKIYKESLTLPTSFAEPPFSYYHERAVRIADKAYDAYIERFYVGYSYKKMADKLNPDGGYG